MELRTEIRRRLRSSRDWASAVGELEREAEGLDSPAERSERLYEAGLLAEEVIPDRERAIDLYQKAWKLQPQNMKPLARMRAVYREMGRLPDVVRVGEDELKVEPAPERRAQILAQLGETLLDLGQKDRALDALEQAIAVLPESTPVRDALAAATYDVEDWVTQVETLSMQAEKADSQTAARMCLRAARILHLEMPDDPA